MPILYAVVARGNVVLAKCAACAGNFTEVCEQILVKVSSKNEKMTYTHGRYLFHYIAENKIIFLCITDDDFERAQAFHFLTDIRDRFVHTYGGSAQTAMPYAMNSDFSRTLETQMKHYSGSGLGGAAGSPEKVTQVQQQVDELHGIMVKNIDSITRRGERLELLVDKTDELSNSSVAFNRTSKRLSRAMFLKNIKLTIIIVIIVIIILYFVISMACGGLAWQNCVK